MSQIRHYALTMARSSYTFWCLRPVIHDDFGWKGCTTERLYDLNLNTPKGVEDFVTWIDAIHQWGLTEHFEYCQRDLDVLLKLRDPKK